MTPRTDLRDPRAVPIDAADTHRLRHLVLRDGALGADLDWDDDHDERTLHLGIRIVDAVVAVSSWTRSAWEHEPDRVAVQLRGMATDPNHAGSGLGTTLLQAGIEHARSVGAHVVWANARVTALGFYERSGFTVTGDVFLTPATGLPHRLVHVRL